MTASMCPYTVAMKINQQSTVDTYTVIMADENYANQAKAAVGTGPCMQFMRMKTRIMYTA